MDPLIQFRHRISLLTQYSASISEYGYPMKDFDLWHTIHHTIQDNPQQRRRMLHESFAPQRQGCPTHPLITEQPAEKNSQPKPNPSAGPPCTPCSSRSLSPRNSSQPYARPIRIRKHDAQGHRVAITPAGGPSDARNQPHEALQWMRIEQGRRPLVLNDSSWLEAGPAFPGLVLDPHQIWDT